VPDGERVTDVSATDEPTVTFVEESDKVVEGPAVVVTGGIDVTGAVTMVAVL
jgi:hypothetical protein